MRRIISMSSTAIIIPTRLDAERLPNKPLKLINGKETILHVYNSAIKAGIGDVIVVTPDKIIFDLITKSGGLAFVSKKNHKTGTDRVFEAFNEYFTKKPNNIINLQGDMPNLNPNDIIKLNNYLIQKNCDICTLASKLESQEEYKNKNIVKVITKNGIENSIFFEAMDFKRENIDRESKYIYHHIGIYGFTKEALIRYVNLERSKLEVERNLEQMRALEAKMKIHVGLSKSRPLSIDTEEDLLKVKKLMEKNEKN